MNVWDSKKLRFFENHAKIYFFIKKSAGEIVYLILMG